MDTASKARKALLFEEAPDAEGEPGKLGAEMTTEALEEKTKTSDTVMVDTVPIVEVPVIADTPLEEGEFSDSDLLVDTEEIQDWEQGEIEEYQQEFEGEDSNAEGAFKEVVEEQMQEVKDKKENQEKDTNKRAQKGGKRTAISILSPRKKLLAKAVSKVGGKGGGQAKKAPTKVSKGAA